ncbi:MAG: hypothetical protein C4589_08285 [Peptococcaceae bacterium]|nr:MAG: hypothetical protein C4589_08285 [Peptococcaceae bacterium]
MNRLELIEARLGEALGMIREAVDHSVEVMGEDSASERRVALLWEDFLGDFFSHLKQKSKEKKRNLLGIVSFARIWRR